VPDLAYKRRTCDRATDPINCSWRPGDSVNMSIGQGNVLVTPIQMAVAYAAIANGGTVVTPTLGRAVVDQDGRVLRDLVSARASRPLGLKKGNALEVARLAGIMAAKKTSDLIPLCHPLAISKVELELRPDRKANAVDVEATVKVSGQTGVEMEALTAVSVACLTLYDMAKAVDRGMTIGDIRLTRKSGGKSGDYEAN